MDCIVTFDLEDADQDDYRQAAVILKKLGLSQSCRGSDLPANTFVGLTEFTPLHLSETIKKEFKANKIPLSRLLVAGLSAAPVVVSRPNRR